MAVLRKGILSFLCEQTAGVHGPYRRIINAAREVVKEENYLFLSIPHKSFPIL